MTGADSQDHQPEPRWRVAHGRHTRLVVALTGCLVSLAVPALALSTPVPTADGRIAGALDDPAGLGVTGVPGDDPLLAGTELAGAPPSTLDWVFGESTSIGLPGIPTPELADGPLGVPGIALDAYQFAERTVAEARPGCQLSWSTLAGIGRIESNHASDGRVDVYGNTLGPILGPQLNGSPGLAAIADTDHGVLDQDTVWDRAVGPMQFIPSSWRSYGVDGNGDGVANPNNIYDATIAAGLYLCAGEADLSDPAQLRAAVFRYNHSASYVSTVLRWAQAYRTNVIPTPSAPGPVPPGTNGNGRQPILPDAASLALAVEQAIPLAPTLTPMPSLRPPEPPPTTTTPPPTTTPTPTTMPAPTPSSDITPSSPLPAPPTVTPPATSPSASPTPPPVTTPLPAEPSPLPVPAPTPTLTPSPSPTSTPTP
jgi:Transglycosylase SLT domain